MGTIHNLAALGQVPVAIFLYLCGQQIQSPDSEG